MWCTTTPISWIPWLWRTEPWYFYRQNPDGSSADGSGCGNDLASERSMCARYILESVLYWAEEYHMDGFRFDLMALLDTGLMSRIRRRAGPPLRQGGEDPLRRALERPCQPHAPGGHPLGQAGPCPPWMKTSARFCDATRDLVKGHILHAERPGFVNGGSARLSALASAITGWAGVQGGRFASRAPLPDHQPTCPATTTGPCGTSW